MKVKITSKTIINGINADLLKALSEDAEDHNRRHKVHEDDKTSVTLDQFYKLIGLK